MNCAGASLTAMGSRSLQPMYRAAISRAMIRASKKYRMVMITAQRTAGTQDISERMSGNCG